MLQFFFLQCLYHIRSGLSTFHGVNLTMEKLIIVGYLLIRAKMLSRKFLSRGFASFYHCQKLKV